MCTLRPPFPEGAGIDQLHREARIVPAGRRQLQRRQHREGGRAGDIHPDGAVTVCPLGKIRQENSNMNVPNRISVYIMNYKIVAQWLNPSDNQIYIYESDTIDYDPSDYVLGKDIEVYIDNLDPKKYYMNIDTLPKIAN